MTLKKKILVGYGVACALMSLVVAWAVANLVSLGQASDAILRENYRSILAAENMVNVLERQDSGILVMLLGETVEGASQFRAGEAEFLQWFARAKDNVTVPGEAELVRSIEERYAEYRGRFSTLADAASAERPAGASPHQLYQESIHPTFATVREACIQLRKLNEETMYAASLRAGRVAERAIWSTALVAAAASLVALVFSVLLAERIVRPLRRFMEASRTISSGNYAVQVPIETGDELGHLAGEFNRMAAQLGRYHELDIEQIIAEKNKGEAVLASIEDGVVVFDEDLKVEDINPAARRMLGLDRTEPAGLPCGDILPIPAACDMIRKTVETGAQPSVPEEQRIVTLPRGDGSRHCLFSVTAIRGKDRALSGVVLLLRDVTRLKEVERLKSEFVTAASHELRTPLTSIGMSIDLLREHATPGLAEKDRELLEAAHEEVRRMQALVSDLLELSRIEAGKIELEYERIPVCALFERVKEIFAGQAGEKGVELAAEVPGDLPAIRADATKVTWVLTNLVSNALRYVSRGGHIQLLARMMGPHVQLAVRDDGPGIPPEYQTRIFQKFVQVRGQEGGGAGLGLAICKEIVRAHGGTIWVESSPGEGSTFTFTMPVGAA